MRPTINFFIEESKTYSNKVVFGLCDDDNDLPAYIDDDVANKNSKWIAQVNNDSLKEIDFYPVDHCIELKRADNTEAQRCEGILRYEDNNILFIELKDSRADWLTKAMEQIIETMSFFFDNYDSEAFNIKAWICNKQLTNQNYFQHIQDFKERTKVFCNKKRGFVLYVCKSLHV